MSARRFKPYPAYKDSGADWLAQIPEHWNVTRVKRVFRVINGSTQTALKQTTGTARSLG